MSISRQEKKQLLTELLVSYSVVLKALKEKVHALVAKTPEMLVFILAVVFSTEQLNTKQVSRRFISVSSKYKAFLIIGVAMLNYLMKYDGICWI